ncbi:MAG: hypothetical protein U9N40_01835 [Euryarchaeota archaeon]|nr:hypothetical protein [Euryarchaeota archaeon]
MTEKTTEQFDMLIPPGVPRSIIMEVVEKFDVEVVSRTQRMYFANMDGDSRELLAFRGDRETVEKVQEYVMQKLDEFISDD